MTDARKPPASAVDSIDLTTIDFENVPYLKGRLESCYLQDQRVLLKFDQNRLKTIDAIFDEIIRRHGIRDVEIDYLLKDAK